MIIIVQDVTDEPICIDSPNPNVLITILPVIKL